ncbi:uncharacterized protein LOC120117476 [Hibiscus syriacus]|uniref:uncharacterized protein LOC120117476 n=1 Tax=Hibiscus syriacus TaxID=106335 RepID=UPI001921B8C1|nr:uncharacterized protein LOC120117476 [Hibiscus syriacus]
MGGCASKPKELDSHARSPLSSDNTQPETTAQSNTNGGENQIEKAEPEGEKEAETSSSEAVSAGTDVPKAEEPTEDDEVKASKEDNEDKVEDVTKEAVKEAESGAHKSNDVPPSKEKVKSDAPVEDGSKIQA